MSGLSRVTAATAQSLRNKEFMQAEADFCTKHLAKISSEADLDDYVYFSLSELIKANQDCGNIALTSQEVLNLVRDPDAFIETDKKWQARVLVGRDSNESTERSRAGFLDKLRAAICSLRTVCSLLPLIPSRFDAVYVADSDFSFEPLKIDLIVSLNTRTNGRASAKSKSNDLILL